LSPLENPYLLCKAFRNRLKDRALTMSTSQSVRPIRKAVFPVAGLGTRFLPATKSVPKEMLTIVDRPILQYAVDEARAAGIEHLIFVTGRGKTIIEDHFDLGFELEATLEARGKKPALDALRAALPKAGSVTYTRQQQPLGLGHAVWCAREMVGDEPFALLLPDMLMKADTPCLKTMVEVYNETGGNVVAVEECDPALTAQYGVVGVGEILNDDAFRITAMVEKPQPKDAPSNLFINGRYILQPEIFDLLGKHERGAGNEIQLTDAMLKLAKTQPFTATRFHGQTFDCGNKLGFIEANIALALDDKSIAQEVEKLLQKYSSGIAQAQHKHGT
jgi:UTP--glucose-1-phosphate uridylyltransferase